MAASVTFHFDGPIAPEHRLELRTLARTLDHLQNAIDRAYLDGKYVNGVYKGARIGRDDYEPTTFYTAPAREGGFILDLFSSEGDGIVARISRAVGKTFEQDFEDGLDDIQRLTVQAPIRAARAADAPSYEAYAEQYETRDNGQFGDRSILKEFDQILVPIRRDPVSTLDFSFRFEDNQVTEYSFDQRRALAFHKVIQRRDLGDPIFVTGTVRSLDGGRKNSPLKGVITNVMTGRDHAMRISSEEDYNLLVPYMQRVAGEQQSIEMLVAPIYEYQTFDPRGGDFFFLGVVR